MGLVCAAAYILFWYLIQSQYKSVFVHKVTKYSRPMAEPKNHSLLLEVDKVNIMSMRGDCVEGSKEEFIV
jgi:hypothetical protein